jgi:hypothetical protein
MSTDDSTDVRWMTYDEMAEAMGITPDSARRLVARRKWARRQGNDGRARVGVPAERIPDSPPDALPDVDEDDSQDDTPDSRDDITPVLKVLTQHIERIEKELDAVKNERDVERRRAAELALQAAQVDTLKSVIDDLKAERDRWASAAEASQQQLDRVIEASKVEQHRSWWPFRKRA